MKGTAPVLAVVTLAYGCGTPPAARSGAPAPPPGAAVPQNLVDLTHAFDAETIYWPTEAGFELQNVAYGRTEAGYFYAANRFCAAEHGGTHIDAPLHFAEGHPATDEIPLERLVGAGVLVDLRQRVGDDRDYRIAVSDLEGWEREHDTSIPAGGIVLLRTGWGSRWHDREAYLGTTRTGPEAVAELHFPGLHPDAARWLVARSIGAVGIDTPSIDYGQSSLFESHVTLFAADIPAFENVAELDRLPERDFVVAALPMKIRGGSGGPLRIVAWW